MQTDVAHGAKHYEVVFSVVTISANLALRILYLSLPLFLLYDGLAVAGLLQVHLLLLLLHVVEEYFFVCVNLVNQLKGIVFGDGHEWLGYHWKSGGINGGFQDRYYVVNGQM